MPFPVKKRVVYAKNTLAEVSARFKFNPILKIETAIPAEFQEAIRADYPVWQREVVRMLPPDMPPAVRNMVKPFFETGQGQPQHAFNSEDQRWRIVLSRDTLVLMTKQYSVWAEFESRLNNVRDAFEKAYRPGRYRELHLRYINVIQRSKLGLLKKSWAELLNPHIAGELANDAIEADIDKLSRQLHCELDDKGSYLWLKTALATPQGQQNNAQQGQKKKPELAFVIDNDFHTHGPTENTNVGEILSRFNGYSRDLFQWAILPALHDAMEPKPGD
jgi:uncharacterized protein (TIGR04255 family)